MMTYTAQTNVTINAPAAKVWDALVDPEIISQYLHGTQTITDWEVGKPIVWRGEWKGESYEDKGTVLAFEPHRLLKYSHWSPMSGGEDKPENYHDVTYELSERDDKTVLTFTQGNSHTQGEADNTVRSFWAPALQIIKDITER